jgi:dolichyl-phosphate-mannose--protein O-mannosyl transferase
MGLTVEGMFSTLSSLLLTGISLVMVVASAFAFLHCLRARPDAFPAIGRSSKGLWLALTGSAVVASLVFSPMSIFGIAAIVIAAVYLLDIRPRIIEITSGY